LLLNKPFDFEEFKQRFLTGKKSVTVYDMFDSIIQENRAKDKINNSEAYKVAKQSLMKFRPGNVAFQDIDYKFLKAYEKHLFERGVNGGGANHYIRTLRACYREAMKRGYVHPDCYPFRSQLKPNGYTFAHLKTKRKVRAINLEDLQRIKDFTTGFELDLWLFSYYGGGINLWDIAQLKPANIYSEYLHYVRSKTGEEFTIKLRDEAKEILKKYEGSEYLFPILSSFHVTMQQKKDRLKKVAKKINKKLRDIAKQLQIDVRFTFHTARHTMASVLLDRGVDAVTIQQVMGHTDLKTTQGYLESLKKSAVDDALMVL
nr:site-specific integrase [Bacteroidia bacterium]